jgi:hypothetical protein
MVEGTIPNSGCEIYVSILPLKYDRFSTEHAITTYPVYIFQYIFPYNTHPHTNLGEHLVI